jgi:hypothetical protein
LSIFRDLAFTPVAVCEQAFLVVVQLLARLRRELEVRSLDDGIDRAGLLAKATVDGLFVVVVVGVIAGSLAECGST